MVKYSISCISLQFGNYDLKGQGQTSILNVKSYMVKNKIPPFHGRFKCRHIIGNDHLYIALYFKDIPVMKQWRERANILLQMKGKQFPVIGQMVKKPQTSMLTGGLENQTKTMVK